jgi:transketolase
VHAGPIRLTLGEAIQVRDGNAATVFFTGTIGNQVMPAVEELDRQGVHCRVVSLHTVKPIDRAAIVRAARETGAIVTVEEHQLQGGLGSAVAEVLCDEGVGPTRFLRLGLPDEYVSRVGSHEWLLDQYGLSAPRLTARLQEFLGAARR